MIVNWLPFCYTWNIAKSLIHPSIYQQLEVADKTRWWEISMAEELKKKKKLKINRKQLIRLWKKKNPTKNTHKKTQTKSETRVRKRGVERGNYRCVEKRKISYFVLARNLIQHWISPNQDDLSHSARTFISG